MYAVFLGNAGLRFGVCGGYAGESAFFLEEFLVDGLAEEEGVGHEGEEEGAGCGVEDGGFGPVGWEGWLVMVRERSSGLVGIGTGEGEGVGKAYQALSR